MKKIRMLCVVLIMMLGVSGCTFRRGREEPEPLDYSGKIAEMTQYAEEKYGEEFEFVEFVPTISRRYRSESDSYKLVLEHSKLIHRQVDKDIYINVEERVSDSNQYGDDYMRNYTSYLMRDSIDYSGISDLNIAKTYLSTRLSSDEYENLKNNKYEITGEEFFKLRCVIFIKGVPTDENLEELYEVYISSVELTNKLGLETRSFIVAFGDDIEKNKIYVNNYYDMFTYYWEDYDRTLTHTMVIASETLSYEEFCDTLEEIPLEENPLEEDR